MDPSTQSTAQVNPMEPTEKDVEKGAGVQVTHDPTKTSILESSSANSSSDVEIAPTPILLKGKLARWNDWVESLSGLEARGIVRVLPEERVTPRGWYGYLRIFALWFSMNLVATNIVTGLLGPLIFGLGWTDCVCIICFAHIFAACAPAYMATWGASSGNRTMVLGRFFMGYYPAKVACILNLIMQIGWGIIGCILAGQMFSAINGQGLTVAVGCVVAALLIGLIATFGIGLVYKVDLCALTYAFIPQAIAMFVLIGSSGSNWDRTMVSMGPTEEDPTASITANRASFFALVFSSIIGFAAVASDFFVYYPVNTSKILTFSCTWLATYIPLVFLNIIGVGIATGVANVPEWSAAYEISSGALLLEAYSGLSGFAGFCVVILALGSVTNNAPCTYAAANTFQTLGRYTKAIPRWFWCVVITVIELVCSVAGRNDLFAIFQNFLPLMAYWVTPWVTIVLLEHLIFHKLRKVPFDWAQWENKKKLPIGAAALLSWLIGWAGAIVGMYQVWYTGPIALEVGGHGADIGPWLSIAWCGIAYVPLRWLELKKFGR